MDGIEVRIGYKEDMTENGLYWCFDRGMTLQEVKQKIQNSLKGTDREHFLKSLEIVLWKDWKTWKDYGYGEETYFIQDLDEKKTLEQILDEREENTGKTGEKIRERGLAYLKELVRQAMLGEGVERVDEVAPRIMENCIREAVHYRPIRREWVREGVGEKVRVVRKQSKNER